MKQGILGGTFDPIHIGHLLLAETAREALGLGQVLFAPVGVSPLKQHLQTTPPHHRRVMVELAIADNPNFALSLVDLQRPDPHYSVDTVRLIREQNNLSADDCFFIVGGDSLESLPRWHRADELVSLCRLAVSHRPGYQPDLSILAQQIPGLAARLMWIEMPALNIEASTIRARVAMGQSIRYQTPDSVRAYIEQHQLYRRSE
jgi:nicotinate-nucleotide adenylyltransferase